jgi:TPR repeat protein
MRGISKAKAVAALIFLALSPAGATTYKTMYFECNTRFNEKQCTELGLYHIRKRGEDVLGVQYLQKACKLDSARACTILGNIFKDGKRACKDPFLAKEYFDKGCRLGSHIACDRYNKYRPYVVYIKPSLLDLISDLKGENMNGKCKCGTLSAPAKECIDHSAPK